MRRITSRRFLPVALVVATVVALAATAAFADTYRVRARRHSWDPAIRRVVRGDRVLWTNPTTQDHNVVAYRGEWTKNTYLDPGERSTKRFWRVGTYKYRCTLHSGMLEGQCDGMCGVVRVRRPS